ncbi:hypothetical protein ACWEO2_10990 [Nocardia sp. NPDC004278]
MDPAIAIVPMGLGHLRQVLDEALPAIPPGAKRALIRHGRLAAR